MANRTEFVWARCRRLVADPRWGGSIFVATRSVLIYVEGKEAAFRVFHRVLRPVGRVSIFEPINSYFPDDMEKIWVSEGWDARRQPNDPMMNSCGKEAWLAEFGSPRFMVALTIPRCH